VITGIYKPIPIESIDDKDYVFSQILG